MIKLAELQEEMEGRVIARAFWEEYNSISKEAAEKKEKPKKGFGGALAGGLFGGLAARGATAGLNPLISLPATAAGVYGGSKAGKALGSSLDKRLAAWKKKRKKKSN